MRDIIILELIAAGRLRVDAEAGLVYAPKSNTPNKPVGARTKKGYLRLCINVDSRRLFFMVHRIVWVSVRGPIPKGHEIDHADTIKSNNRIGNLEAVTGRVNMDRAKAKNAFARCGRKDGIRDADGRFGKAAGRLLDGREWNEMPYAPA